MAELVNAHAFSGVQILSKPNLTQHCKHFASTSYLCNCK